MDYLFYGNVVITKTTRTTTISLNIHCESDEILNLYELSPDVSRRLAYKQMSVERHTDGLTATFGVQDDNLYLFVVAGQSNESDIPFEVTYAVYGSEVVSLPENSILYLEGTTHILPGEK